MLTLLDDMARGVYGQLLLLSSSLTHHHEICHPSVMVMMMVMAMRATGVSIAVREKERQPEKGGKSRKFTRMGQGGLGHQDTSVDLDTRITGHQDTRTPGFNRLDQYLPRWSGWGQGVPG